MKDKIVDILDYEYTNNGGYVTVKFESGYTTRRRFNNIRFDKHKRCSITGNIPKEGTLGIHFSIKKRGYSRYNITMESVNKLLTGEPVIDENESEIGKALTAYMTLLKKQRRKCEEQDRELREALRKIKFKNSNISKRMSATYKLIELVSEDTCIED